MCVAVDGRNLIISAGGLGHHALGGGAHVVVVAAAVGALLHLSGVRFRGLGAVAVGRAAPDEPCTALIGDRARIVPCKE